MYTLLFITKEKNSNTFIKEKNCVFHLKFSHRTNSNIVLQISTRNNSLE